MRAKISKLEKQFNEQGESGLSLFSGVSIYVNGYTGWIISRFSIISIYRPTCFGLTRFNNTPWRSLPSILQSISSYSCDCQSFTLWKTK